MTGTKVLTAKIEGYEGPFFPSSLDAIELMSYKWLMWDRYALGCAHFAEFARKVEGYEEGVRSLLGPETMDGYYWYAGVVLENETGSVALLLPRKREGRGLDDGTAERRHTAVYTKGHVEDAEIDRILHAITVQLMDRAYTFLTEENYDLKEKLNAPKKRRKWF